MKEMCKLKKNMSNAAGQFGFGMGTATDGSYDKKMDEAYAQSMASFSAGHTNTTLTISGLKSSNAQQATTTVQQQQQLMMMQQQFAANAYAATLNMLHPPRPTTSINTITTMVDGRGEA